MNGVIKNKNIILVIGLLFLLSSCATETLWERTDPNAYVKMNFTEITEEELKNRGAKYIRDDNKQAFYIQKGSFHKFTDYSVRVLATPVTVVIDTTVVVIFAAAFVVVDSAMDDAREKGCTATPDCRERRERGQYSDR